MPTTANPGGPGELAAVQARQLEHLRPTRAHTCTCTPCLVGDHPPPGSAAARGLLEENRRATMAVDRAPRNEHSMLGWPMSRLVPGEVPLICGVAPGYDEAKRLAFSINHQGNVPLLHLSRGAPPPGWRRLTYRPRIGTSPCRRAVSTPTW